MKQNLLKKQVSNETIKLVPNISFIIIIDFPHGIPFQLVRESRYRLLN